MDITTVMDQINTVIGAMAPWHVMAITSVLVIGMNSLVQWWLYPKNHPTFYWEFPYIPWLGSLVQFATQPREFLERAATQCGSIFTIQLFGKKNDLFDGIART